ncbi:MAG: hypothetical protein QOC92_1696 [Acidimicrobiaceae bacterium]|jgi:poly-gamma-glutamate capsule biosynthesis protein CapA/YwtB (metallophosphatase superfamily)
MARRRPQHLAVSSRTGVVLRRIIMVAIAVVLLVGGGYVVAKRDDKAAVSRSVPTSTTTAPSTTASTQPVASVESTTVPEATFTISAVGDTMLGKSGSLPPNPATYFSAVDAEIRGDAQIVFANLEGTFSDVSGSKCGDSTSGNCFAFQVPPSFSQHFAGAGFTVLNTANNHSHDFGSAGLDQTVTAIRSAGMVETGLPGQATVVQAGAIRVGLVGFAPYRETASMHDLPAARALIGKAREQSDVVVVYMHAGAEGTDAQHVTGESELYLGEDRGNAQQFAHMAIDEGAGLVLGSGPHVLRGVEFYKGRLIAYSLGNFAGYTNFNTSSGVLTNSAILHVTLNRRGEFQAGRLVPVTLTAKNQPLPGGGSVALVERLSNEDFGPAAAHFTSDGTISAP